MTSGTLIYHWWECKMVQLLWKTVWQTLKQLHRIAIWFSNSSPRGKSKRIQNRCSCKHFSRNSHSSTLHNGQNMETTPMSIGEWMDLNKTGSTHTMEYYSPIKRDEVLIRATTWMNLKNIKPGEEKPDTKGHIVCDSTSCKISRLSESIEAENWLMFARVWGRKEQGAQVFTLYFRVMKILWN